MSWSYWSLCRREFVFFSCGDNIIPNSATLESSQVEVTHQIRSSFIFKHPTRRSCWVQQESIGRWFAGSTSHGMDVLCRRPSCVLKRSGCSYYYNSFKETNHDPIFAKPLFHLGQLADILVYSLKSMHTEESFVVHDASIAEK